ncbi:HAMP domain-containing histidine kinase [Omnitrophica bacterium]|nr:HAMP domain-containing histidine kinase [Candidatus Omnitrophota bacterium]
MMRRNGLVQEETEINQSVKEEENKLTIDTLAAGLAHELGNPIDAVRRYVHLALLQSTGEPLTREYLLKAKLGISRIIRILHDLLVYSKQGYEAKDEWVEIHSLLEESLKTFGTEPCLQGISVQRIYSTQGPFYVNRAGLPLVLQNLFKNAVQAMNGRGTLTLATWPQNGSIGVSVKDTGGGIPAAIQARIFEPFFSTKNRDEGTGIGLTLARDIVKRGGGEMRCENISDPVSGACFIFTLPRKPASKFMKEEGLG